MSAPPNLPTNHQTGQPVPSADFNDLALAANTSSTAATALAALVAALQTKTGVGTGGPTNGLVLTGGATPGTSSWAAPGVVSGNTMANIMASGSGVVGNGVAEDHAAINAIIATSGHYYFPGNRTYLIGDSLWIKTSNVTLEFGPGAIVKMKNVGNQPNLAIGNEAFSTINNITIIGGAFDGNASNQTWRIPHAGVGLAALTGHALFYSGVIGIACWDVYGLSFWGTSVYNTLQHNYTASHCGDVQFIGCKADATGMSRQLKDATGAADPEGNNSFNVYGAPTTGVGKGVRIVGCTVTNCADVGFELHGNGSGEHTIIGCSVIGSCPNGTGNNISAHTGYEFEMESADTANGGFGIIAGNVADGLNIAYSALNTANLNYEVKSMVIGPNHAANCTTGLDIAGRHISVNGLVCENMGQDGIKNSIQAWITKTSNNSPGNTSTVINFPGSSFSAAQQALLVGYYATITSGTGSGLASYRQITACTATSITVTPGYTITPDATSVFKFTNHGDWTISNCVFHVTGQGNQYGGIVLLAGAGVVFDGIAINNCVFHGVGPTGTSFLYSGVYSAGNVLNLEINGCIAHGFKNGLQCNQPQAVHINGGTYHHNNETGITIANATGVANTGSIIQNTRCVDNAVNPTSGTDAGIYLDNAVDTILEGNVSTNTYAGGLQSSGLKLSANAVGVTVKDGDLRGNVAALGGTLNTTTLKEMSGVLGVNDIPVAGATGAAGASIYLVPKSYRPSSLGVFGGTVSLITVGGITVATAPNVVVHVPANVQAAITHTGAPTLSQVLL